MYEHSYHMDFGAAAGSYVDAFMGNIHWGKVYERYQLAVEGTSGGLAATHDDLVGAHLLDVRRAGVFEQAQTVIPGATWRDPQAVATWSQTLPAGEPVVVYCVYGHEVGRSTAMRLRAAGIDARFLRGGIDGWQAVGRELAPKSPSRESVLHSQP